MFWDALRLSTEDILGSVHCVLRARRLDVDRSPTWDDLWRGTLNPPDGISDTDQVWWILHQLCEDLNPVRRENGPL